MYSMAEFRQLVTLKSKEGDIHFVRISHLLDLLPAELGRMLLSSSNKVFISLRLLRSAIL